MDYGVAFRIVAEAAGKFPVSDQSCKLHGMYCSTVGKTGLPTDPPPPEPEVPPPTLTSVSPISGLVGSNFTLTGTNLGTEQGMVVIGAITQAVIVSWADTQIVATVPSGVEEGVPQTITVGLPGGVQVELANAFTVEAAPAPPVVASVSPVSGEPGAAVTITGTGFGATQGAGKAQIGGFDLLGITWGDTQISGSANIGFGQYDVPVAVVVTNNAGVASNADVMFTFTEPVPVVEITGASPASGPDGTEITITGYGFGATQGAGWALVGAEGPGAYISWSDTQIVIVAAQGATPLDVAQMLQVQIDPSLGSYQSAPFDGFTFTTAAARGSSKKAAKKTSKTEVKVEPPKEEEKPKEAKSKRDMGKDKVTERPKVEERAAGDGFPAFDSGAGFMLLQHDVAGGKIMMGPTELKEGQHYPLDIDCRNGLQVEVNGPCDITFFLLR